MDHPTRWPVVVVGDSGIRPAGLPDECFYCHQKIGAKHARDCVTVHKKIRARYIFEVDLEVPHHWTPENFLFHRNEGTWCANNALDELEGLEEGDTTGDCLCHRFTAEFISVLSEEPIRSK